MPERQTLLFANEAFYAAFNAADLTAMERAWAKQDPVFCLHPGWPALQGRAAVLESWRGIFAGGGTPTVLCRGARAEIVEGLGVVLCYEVLGRSVLAATNLFRREAGQWRLVHHQAGPCQQPPSEVFAEEPPPKVQ